MHFTDYKITEIFYRVDPTYSIGGALSSELHELEGVTPIPAPSGAEV